jgi:hypothetical protein
VNRRARKQQQQMDPGRGCPAQIPGRGQYVHSPHRSEVEEVGRRRKGPREHTGHIDKTGTDRAEGDGETMIVRRRSFPFRRQFHVRTRT